jgi:hypothetical protein
LRVLWKLCQEGIEKVHRVHGRELYLEFGEKTESLRILENSARRALSWCNSAQNNSIMSSEEGEVSREYLHRVTEHPTNSTRSA